MNDDFQPLDLAACYGADWTGRLISYGTASLLAPRRLRIGPSHIALICAHHGGPVWVESTTLCSHPCVIMGHHVSGVQAHLPEARIDDYAQSGGHVDLYRLSPIDRLSPTESELLTRILIRHFIGRQVTYDMGGALLSGTRLFKRTRLLPNADLNELFCSELVAAVLMRLSRLNRTNPTRYNPACLLRQLVREGSYQFEREFTGKEVLAT
ncbi:MAG: hypothetical protein HOK71_15230 [Planctomycetaceae bacterium]|jgi:hypothetical protein|nr:hypothetical protein [Planctomycetaceae bacterium]